ncbi:aminopeptidase [Alkalibaculum sp. M08DMB]|uniref:M18 family aminopeptidase n=1 Tax=Alkalibaculum sporogenes TaxID=2655001 RepID=A0A6A7K611_9FIRM|nr:aminopeptidase [Alkalibaculum sporogenes]MPW24822.1 aminopeptidase [Alkalibaculum sporogenes]
MSQNKDLENLLVKRYDNAWRRLQDNEKDLVFDFGESYKTYLDKCKTERECALYSVKLAEEKGFKSIDYYIYNDIKIKHGDKIYGIFKDKTVVLFVIGEEDFNNGMNIIGSHVDCPRLDLKQAPLYEDTELAFFKTHYYGGIKKYQWTTIPLALHGVVVKQDGTKINICIGELENEPIFFITDLLPHLSKEQLAKKLDDAITGENLNVIVGSIPLLDEEIKDSVKLNILKWLHEKYEISEEDLASAELEIVPAGKARDVGFDKGLIGAYGHDDRVCAYSSIEALFDINKPKKTCVAVLADKEEIGSVGNTGMTSKYFENVLMEIIHLSGVKDRDLVIRRCLMNSKFLSADVNAAVDPNYPNTHDKLNAAYVGKGLVVTKYTGSRGKAGSNDANAEFMAEVRRIFNENDICWQMGELGKVDAGGGGTIAYIPAQYGMDVIDVGIALLSMHAPYEIASKVDIYMSYKGFKAFYKSENM